MDYRLKLRGDDEIQMVMYLWSVYKTTKRGDHITIPPNRWFKLQHAAWSLRDKQYLLRVNAPEKSFWYATVSLDVTLSTVFEFWLKRLVFNQSNELELLSAEYTRWLSNFGWPEMSADELLLSYANRMTRYERVYLSNFSLRWEAAQRIADNEALQEGRRNN